MSEEHPPPAAAVVPPNLESLTWENGIAGERELTAAPKASPVMTATGLAAASTSTSLVAPREDCQLDSRDSWRCADVHSRSLIAQARRRLDFVGGIDGVGYDLRVKDAARAGVQPMRWSTNTRELRSDVDDDGKDDQEGGAESAAHVRKLAATLACNPRIVGYDEDGVEEVAAASMRQAECRRNQPLGMNDYFRGYCHEADMYLPIRAKYCKKHGFIVAKFDHFCYLIGNSVGELNHGRFYRLLLVQVISIWMGFWLLSHAYLAFETTLAWTAINIPLVLLNILTVCRPNMP
jgi:hypothetical protein